MSAYTSHIACMPVALAAIYAPDYIEKVSKLEGSTFEQALCPNCGESMWLGSRSAKLVANGTSVLCMVCIITVVVSPRTSRLEARAAVAKALLDIQGMTVSNGI